METFCFAGLFICTPFIFITSRALYLIYQIFTKECKLSKSSNFSVMVCMGSGGHTSEICRLIKYFNMDCFTYRGYVVADNDNNSVAKIEELEKYFVKSDYKIYKIPRSRNVNQSFTSAIGTTLGAFLRSLPIVYKFKPDVILCNGPGTCIPICIAAFLMRCLYLLDCRMIFIESICRVRTLSLTGKILQFIADIYIVQWPQLRDVCHRAKYFGRLT